MVRALDPVAGTGSLARRLWWGLVGTAALAALATGGMAWLTARARLLSEAAEGLRNRAEHLARAPQPPRPPREGEGPRPSRAAGGLLVCISLPDGSVLTRSEDWPVDVPTRLDHVGQITLLTLAGRHFHALQLPLEPRSPEGAGRGAGPSRAGRWQPPPPVPGTMMLVVQDVSELHRDLQRLGLLLIGVGCVVVVVAALLAGRLRDGLLAPLRRLAARIDALPSDDLTARLGGADLPRELCQLVERLDGALERLAAARRRERRGIADVAHELRTPLAALRSELEFAAAAGDVPADRARPLQSQVEALQHRVERLLLLSRVEAGRVALKAQELSLAELVADAWAPVAAEAAGRGLTLSLDDPEGVVLVGDAALLGCLFANLLGNAVAHAAAAPVAVSARRGEGLLQLELANPVADMAAGDYQVAFDPYWRHDAARSGERHHGLGLTLVRRIAELHGASIAARVDPEGRFLVTMLWPQQKLC